MSLDRVTRARTPDPGRSRKGSALASRPSSCFRRLRLRNVLHADQRGVDLSAYFGQRFRRFLEVSRTNRCARFLQVCAGVAQRGLPGAERLRGRGRFCRGAQCRLQPIDERRDFAVERFRFGPGPRPPVGGQPLGLDGALPRVERVVQRLAIVALPDGRVGLVERRGGGGVFRGRVALGAGRTGGVDGAARLIDFLLRGTGTASDEEDENSQGRQATHDSKV